MVLAICLWFVSFRGEAATIFFGLKLSCKYLAHNELRIQYMSVGATQFVILFRFFCDQLVAFPGLFAAV
jgi:hypothetical protein